VSLIRLNTDGSFDSTFDGDGVVHTVLANQEGEGHSVIIGADGKITVGGAVTQIGTVFYDAAILRYNPNGSLDVSFDGDGIKMVEFIGNNENYRFREIVQQPDGKYVAIAEYRILYTFFTPNDFFVTRLNEDGSSDDSFDANSKVKSQWCEDGSELVYNRTARSSLSVRRPGRELQGQYTVFVCSGLAQTAPLIIHLMPERQTEKLFWGNMI